MKSIVALSMLVASALAAATPPLQNSPWSPGPSGPALQSQGYVILQFSDDLSSNPNPINVPIPLGPGGRRMDIVVDPNRKASSVQVVDQSHAPSGFQCYVRVVGQGEVTHHISPINTFRSFGASVRMGNVFVECTP